MEFSCNNYPILCVDIAGMIHWLNFMMVKEKNMVDVDDNLKV